ncbi:MAG: hypothetical protein JWO99_332 [Candidatus Saccharibacteria bacterium]|nr:hypothetical protein [Candidatus Saccharibacteria bacterium]
MLLLVHFFEITSERGRFEREEEGVQRFCHRSVVEHRLAVLHLKFKVESALVKPALFAEAHLYDFASDDLDVWIALNDVGDVEGDELPHRLRVETSGFNVNPQLLMDGL